MQIDIHVKFDLPLISGKITKGHKEGCIQIDAEDYELFKIDPEAYLREHDLLSKLSVVIDDYKVYACGVDNIEHKVQMPLSPCRQCGTWASSCCGCQKYYDYKKERDKIEKLIKKGE